ncbi:hypothetical protein [Hymenobacter baengnokdamensis]|uniref:hypothetical protein n=1 Tax=Hymenobacter baengnokdamensis TaxID=2615203 RepID=UPI00124578E3|nr:hypothetical protein [Hymenobacter baengnokdamensis]
MASSAQTTQAAFSLPPESITYQHNRLAASNLKRDNKLNQYTKYDFSSLWLKTPNAAVVGFIGPACQRLRVKILTVQQDAANPARYQLMGKTKVTGRVSTFSGVLVIRQIRELRQLATRVDETVSPARQEGILLADYELRENAAQSKSGIFRGVVETDWFVDKWGRLKYDDIRTTDRFCNNQFLGSWTSYTSGKALRCNWGDYRIPNSGDFDIGVGEFSPADKYLAAGWLDMRDCTFGNTNRARSAAACKREAQIWWK